MIQSIENYLSALKLSLQDADPALIQDALWDVETHLRAGVAALREKSPEMSEEQAISKLIESFGTPEEVAQAYREREKVVETALRPRLDSETPDAASKPLDPWPGFFQVLKTPKAYTSLLYLIMALPVGIFFFTWAVTGISLSLGLMILVIGLPLAIAFLGSVRMLALVEGRLVEALLDVRMPRRPSLLPEGKTWVQKLKNLLLDGHTWSSLVYLVLHLPFGIAFFTMMVVGISLSFGLIAAPISYWIFGADVVVFGLQGVSYTWALVISPIVGALCLILTLHLALALGRFQGLLAKYMLISR